MSDRFLNKLRQGGNLTLEEELELAQILDQQEFPDENLAMAALVQAVKHFTALVNCVVSRADGSPMTKADAYLAAALVLRQSIDANIQSMREEVENEN